MSREAKLDALVVRALVERGAVSESALAHARAVSERGFEGTATSELLVELELLSADELLQTLSHISGAPIWDGAGLDLELMSRVRAPTGLAVAVRREGSTLLYATVAPHDEQLREDMRFAASALRAEPLVASEETLARAVRPSFEREPEVELDDAALLCPPRSEWDAFELECRRRWTAELQPEHDEPIVRLTNVFLLQHLFRGFGRALRIEATDEPRMRPGRSGEFEPGSLPAPRSAFLLQKVIWRLKFMAAGSAGGGAFRGWIHLRTGRIDRSFHVHVEPTDRGDVTLVMRGMPWQGSRPPERPEWSEHRTAHDAAWRAFEAGQLERAERSYRAALDAAERIGAPALLEQVSTLRELAALLDSQGREPEARPFIERALALATEHELGGRVLFELTALAASTETDDLARRVARFEQAEALGRAPGLGARPTVPMTLEIARSERRRERHEDALAAAERALADDRRWFGARTSFGLAALVEASLACAALERVDDAERLAREALAVTEGLGAAHGFAHWALGRAALIAGNPEAALGQLRQAHAHVTSELDPDGPAIGLDLALAHEALGQLEGAREVALAARARADTPATSAAQRGLEALLRRAGPYR